MVEPVHALEGWGERGRIAQVADHHLGVEPLDIAARRVFPRKENYAFAACDQGPGHRRADEAGRPGHQNLSACAHDPFLWLDPGTSGLPLRPS